MSLNWLKVFRQIKEKQVPLIIINLQEKKTWNYGHIQLDIAKEISENK